MLSLGDISIDASFSIQILCVAECHLSVAKLFSAM